LHDHTAAGKHDYSSSYCRDLSICPSDSEQKQSMSLAHDEQGLARTQRPGRRSSSLEEIIVEVIDDKVELIIHWQGGDHTRWRSHTLKRGGEIPPGESTASPVLVHHAELAWQTAGQLPDHRAADCQQTTRTGLNIECGIDPNTYPAGIKVSDADIAKLELEPHEFHGEWKRNGQVERARAREETTLPGSDSIKVGLASRVSSRTSPMISPAMLWYSGRPRCWPRPQKICRNSLLV
jgi:Rhodopirellula transposase DDE domain